MAEEENYTMCQMNATKAKGAVLNLESALAL